jgi:uncharacterized membrane protein YadS
MRWIFDFYRRSPVVAAVIVLLALAISISTVTFSTGGTVLPLVFALLLGLIVGILVAALQRRD